MDRKQYDIPRGKDAPLMVTISGIRGIAGVSLTPSVIEKYVGGFAALIAEREQREEGFGADVRQTVILGMDSRVTGPWVSDLVKSLLVASGFNVLYIGIAPTPTVQYAVIHHKAAAGVVVTSSHNDEPWNGLKFVDCDGLFLSPDLCQKTFELADKGVRAYIPFTDCGDVNTDLKETLSHVDAILSLDFVRERIEKVRKRNFKVVLDTVNGAGGPTMKLLLEKLGCQVLGMNLEPTGRFAHKPEPIPQHLTSLANRVVKEKADLGIATDPDVDRCVFVGDDGQPLGEEYTLALAVQFMLGSVGRRGYVCKNLSTSRAVDDIAAKYGCEVIATPVGEINVAKKMVEVKSVIGGEGNGGVCLPDVHIGRDAPVAATLALCLLAEFDGTITELKASLPAYSISKRKIGIAGLNPDKILEHFKKEYSGKNDCKLNESDGLRIDGADWWVHLRKSNTEPIMRVIGEKGRTQEESDKLCGSFMDIIVNL